jgi:tetratricopeptide (TPR) repeat protein
MQKLGRNDLCHCGSGNKYKRCCMEKDETNNITRISPKATSELDSIPELINEQLIWDNELYRLIAIQLFNQAKDLYPAQEISMIVKIWRDYSSSEMPVTKKLGVFPAALEYCICQIFGHEINRAQLAEKYKVSTATISQRANQIMDFTESLLDQLNKEHDSMNGISAAPAMSNLAMEQSMQQLLAAIESQGLDNIDDINDFLNSQLAGKPQKQSTKKSASKKEQAQELLYKAWESPDPNKRIQMAKAALELYPDSADAYNILAEHASANLKETAYYYKQGMLAGERDLGEDFFRENRGHFWGYVPTRPYMRAKKGYAETCAHMENQSEAIKHYKELLELNPNDNQGVRDLLLMAYIELEEWSQSAALIKQYDEDHSASFNYNRLLIEYGLHGLSAAMELLLKQAIKQNRHVPKYLSGKKKIPRNTPDYMGYGDDREAVVYAQFHHHFWQSKPELLRWLAVHTT